MVGRLKAKKIKGPHTVNIIIYFFFFRHSFRMSNLVMTRTCNVSTLLFDNRTITVHAFCTNGFFSFSYIYDQWWWLNRTTIPKSTRNPGYFGVWSFGPEPNQKCLTSRRFLTTGVVPTLHGRTQQLAYPYS